MRPPDLEPGLTEGSPAFASPAAGGAAVQAGRAWRWSVDEVGLAEVVFEVPGRSVNTFDSEVVAELEALLGELAADGRITAAIFASGKEKGFIAGADIAEIERLTDPDEARLKVIRGQKVFQELARLPFPTLAVIHGACLGGGLEMALACTHRIAALDAELGLPEVQLGFIPGWGGTQRLPRLVGPRGAIELVCTGKRVDGREALRLGLVDRTSPPRELRSRALAFGREIAGAEAGGGGGDAPRPSVRVRGDVAGAHRRPGLAARLTRLALEGNPVGRRLLFAQARKRIRQKTGGHYPAPLRALEVIEQGLAGSLEAGLALEARIVSGLLVSPVSKNLVHVFKLFEGVKRSPWAEAAEDGPPLERAVVLGAGVMGGGIAALLAGAGLWVRLKDLDTTRVAQGLRAAREILEGRRRRRRLDRAGLRRTMNRIAGTTAESGLRRADVVVEAIVEDLEAKRRAFAGLDALVSPRTLLATNTSSLPVSRIASAVRDPRRVAGLHFFNPVERMPLVEIVRGDETADETVAALYGLALRLGKKPVVVRDRPGFLVNRILMPYLNEAAQLYAEGVETRVVDGAMTAFGMPVGPLALLDDIGLDVAAKVGRILAEAFPERMQPAPVFAALQASGRTGRKGGRGFYLYAGTTRKEPDPSLRAELDRSGETPRVPAGSTPGLPGAAGGTAGASGPSTGGAPDDVEIEHRLVFPMIDEAARCLAEGLAEGPGDVDLAMIAGTGFPPFRGGLLRYADAVGVGSVVAVLERLCRTVGSRLSPSSALREVAVRGFYAHGAGSR